MNNAKARVLILFAAGMFSVNVLAARSVSESDILSGRFVQESLEDGARFEMIRATALEVGVVFGRQQYYKEAKHAFAKMADELDQLNFNYLLIAPGVLPPVYVEASDVFDQESPRKAHMARQIYRMVEPARIVRQAPTWRDYINLDQFADDDRLPEVTIKLRHNKEKRIWAEFAKKGIEAGREQARQEIQYQIARMNRDYKGMLLAHHLHRLGMIDFSRYVVHRNGTLVTDEAANLDDRIIVLDGKDAFKPRSHWKPFVRLEKTNKKPSDSLHSRLRECSGGFTKKPRLQDSSCTD